MSQSPLVYLFTEELNAVVDKYRDQGLTVAEAVGAIEVLKFGVIYDQIDENEDEALNP